MQDKITIILLWKNLSISIMIGVRSFGSRNLQPPITIEPDKVSHL